PFLPTATGPSEPHTLSLHDALPIWASNSSSVISSLSALTDAAGDAATGGATFAAGSPCKASRSFSNSSSVMSPSPLTAASPTARSEEHTSELQSRENLVCRLLLEKK